VESVTKDARTVERNDESFIEYGVALMRSSRHRVVARNHPGLGGRHDSDDRRPAPSSSSDGCHQDPRSDA
jgi:hypothetical protein